jgi:protein SCO1/2
VLALAVAGGIAFAVFQPVTVLARIRPAPGYALVDEHGVRITSEDARGEITLYSFVPLDCGDACDGITSTLREVRDRVPDEVDFDGRPFRVVTIVLADEPTVDEVAAASAAAGDVDDDWRWLAGAGSHVENVVGAGFRHPTDPEAFGPRYTIVDGFGTIRGEYRYQTLADDADKLVRHLGLLGAELRNASGFASLAYDAAHLFQCYP